MKQWLTRVRTKSHDERQRLARTLALVTTIGIVAVWLIILSLQPRRDTESNHQSSPLESFSNFIQTIIDSFNQFQNNFDSVSDTVVETIPIDATTETESDTETEVTNEGNVLVNEE